MTARLAGCWAALVLACSLGTAACTDDDPADGTQSATSSGASTSSGAGAGGSAGGGGEDGGPPPIGDCPMGVPPDLPAGSPRILVIGPESQYDEATAVAEHLRGLFAGDAAFDAPEVVVQHTDTAMGYASSISLMGFWYTPEGRGERLAVFDEPFTWVVLLEDPRFTLYSPELHFEGVRTVACRARGAGMKPILLQTYDALGEDTEFRGEIAYRVGNGTGTPVVPAGYAWEAYLQSLPQAQQPVPGAPPPNPPHPPYSAHARFVAAASVYSAITGKSAASTSYLPSDLPAEHLTGLAAAAQETVAAHEDMTHYTEPYASAVEMRTMEPNAEFWFMSSGSSSEDIWFDRMNEILPKLGLTPKGTAIGYCNEWKIFDLACLDKAKQSFRAAQYQVLFARNYSVTAETTIEEGMQDALQVQVWDRHYDADPPDGAITVAALEGASQNGVAQARDLGVAWIPYHLMFAKLKTARPSVAITSDGIHATYPVGFGLTAMSVESRTPLMVPTDGLDDDTAAAVTFGDETLRQLSSMSQWGTFVPDDPETRPKIR
jgi:hypothetical protein